MTQDVKSYKALAGRCIVVTRASTQAETLGMKLEEAGVLVVFLPLISFKKVESPLPERLSDFDWLVLTSGNAVKFFGANLRAAGKSYRDLKKCRVAVIGEVTGAELDRHGLTADIVPKKQDSTGLIEEILRVETDAKGKKALLPQSNKARGVIADALTSAGMEVHSLTCYETRYRDPADVEIKWLVHLKPDAVTFFSPSTVEAYRRADLPVKVHDAHGQVVYGSIGPVTTEALKRAGLEPIIEAHMQNEDNLIGAMNDYFGSLSGQASK